MDLSKISTNELKEEIKKRERKIKNIPKPYKLKTMNFQALIDMCEDYIKYVASDSHRDDDDVWEMRIYDEAFRIIYGSDIFDWVNNTMVEASRR